MEPLFSSLFPRRTAYPYEAVVIGASAGAVDALSSILPILPANFSLPLIIAVHIPPDKASIMSELFQKKCKLHVREAADKEEIQPNTIYFAAADYHLLVEVNRELSLSSEEPVCFSRPSIDLLFESAADAYGSGLIGVILTGGNSDGARGLRAITDAGGTALVQLPETALAPAMPHAALKECPDAIALSLAEIAAFLVEVNILR